MPHNDDPRTGGIAVNDMLSPKGKQIAIIVKGFPVCRQNIEPTCVWNM